MMTPMKSVSLILCCTLLLSLKALAQEQFISIDGTDIWTHTRGLADRQEGKPVIVLESGFGTPMGHWERILDGIAELAPVVAYDRPGVGKSVPDDELPTVKNVADKLIKILKYHEVPPPYIMVGHSLGGAYVRGFAHYYPEMLAGLVIIDPADFTETQENKRHYYDVLGWDDARIDQELASIDQKWASQEADLPLSLREERQILRTLRENDFAEIVSDPLPNIPVHIITGGRFDMPAKFRSKEYDSEALFRSKMAHRVARWTDVIQSVDKGMLLYSGDAGHFVHFDDPDLVIASVQIVLKDYERMTQQKK